MCQFYFRFWLENGLSELCNHFFHFVYLALVKYFENPLAPEFVFVHTEGGGTLLEKNCNYQSLIGEDEER